MIVAILFIACLLLVIGSIFFGQKLIRTEKTDAVFGNPERASGGWHWIISGVSSLLLLWFYFSWDAARSFFPLAANELCQLAKVSYAIKPGRSMFPFDKPRLKSTTLLERDSAQINHLEQTIPDAGFNENETKRILAIFAELRTTLFALASPTHQTLKTTSELNKIASDIDKLTAQFSDPGYPGEPTSEELATANAQPGWGEVGIEIPYLPITNRGRKFDNASKSIGKIINQFVKIRNKSPYFNGQVDHIKSSIRQFKTYNEGVTDLEKPVAAKRKKLVKRINQVFRRVDDARIFPPAAFDSVEAAIRRFDLERNKQRGNLHLIDMIAMPGGSIIASSQACSEQGSGRWLPKPADAIRNFIRIMNPEIGYKNIPMLWYENKEIGKIIAPIIPDWVADLVPGEFPRHSENGDIPQNFKSKVLKFATGNYQSPSIPLPTGHIWDSLVRVFLGLFFGIICGVPLGIFMGLSRFAKGYFDPIIELYRPVPPLAWAPLVLTIFGIGDSGKIFLLFMVSFAIMVISSRAGATGTQLSKVHAAHSLGASKSQIIREVILPNSLPEILTGIRVAVGVCWGTLVAAEFLAGTTGIGFVENVARKQSDYEMIWVTIVILGVLGLLMDLIMRWIIARTIPWRGKG